MSKSMKKVISLLLVVALAGSLFTACGGRKKPEPTMRPFTTDEINLTYAFWEDDDIFNYIYEDWKLLHPNCTITPVSFPTDTYTESLKALCAAEEIPDVFGVIGSLDFAIESGMLLDMTSLFDADKDAKNVLGGLNEYKIGNFGTDSKWATVIKFYPSAAFINKYMVENSANAEMPDFDWTWEEFEEFVESFQGKKNPDTGAPLIGLESAGGNMPVTWYPLASDANCIGEFGWTESNGGGSYDMQNWADGLNLQRDWLNDRVMISDGDEQYRIDTYGAADRYAQDMGDVAVRGDSWYAFTRYFDNEEQPMLGNNVIFVPYMMPHMSDIAEKDRTYMSTMDLAGISANQGTYAVECYHLLKFFTWGTEGWEAKLKYYPDMVETGDVYGVAGAKYYSNFPITLDDDVWAGYRALWAGADDPYGRAEYFDEFFERAKKAKWSCLGGAQIPGFGTWLNEYYFAEEFAPGYTGVEDAVLNGKMNAEDYYVDLQEKGNEYYNQKLGEIEAMLQ